MPEIAQVLNLQDRLATTLKLGESQFREFKSAWHRGRGGPRPRAVTDVCRDIGDTLVAFANADGGELIVGAEDDGGITGIRYTEQHIETMLHAPTTHVLAETPLASPIAIQMSLSDHKILYFAIMKGTQFIHLTSDGRCLQRFDRENKPVSFEGIQSSVKKDILESTIENLLMAPK